MRYLALDRTVRERLWADLAATPDLLARQLVELPAAERTAAGPAGAFSPVEHCWHLADLEREAFGERLRRLLSEDEPFLPDFDGARVARERDYRSRSLEEALAAFRSAREANLARFASLKADDWPRAGTQEGIGRVAVCDLPVMIAEHDAAHAAEIAEWFASRGSVRPGAD